MVFTACGRPRMCVNSGGETNAQPIQLEAHLLYRFHQNRATLSLARLKEK